MKTKYLLHMLLLGRSQGAAAQTIRLSQEHSGDRTSEETWSLPRADTTTAAASCRVPGQALCSFSLWRILLSTAFDRLFQERKKWHFSCEKCPSWKRQAALNITPCCKRKAVAFPCLVSIPPYWAAAWYFQAPDLPRAQRSIHRLCGIATTGTLAQLLKSRS